MFELLIQKIQVMLRHRSYFYPNVMLRTDMGVAADANAIQSFRARVTEESEQQKIQRRALRVFLILVLFLEFSLQFTILVVLSYVFVILLKVDFRLFALAIIALHFLLTWFFLYPKVKKFTEGIRKDQGIAPLSEGEQKAVFGRAILGYVVNLTITIIVLFLAAILVGAQEENGVPQLGLMLLDGTFEVLSTIIVTFLMFAFTRVFLLA